MRHLLVAAILLTACSSTTSGGLLSIPFAVGGPSVADGGPLVFTAASGWTVELDAASIQLGPFYFNVDPPNTTQYRSGVVIVQSLQQVSVDLLSPALVSVEGGAQGEVGTAVAAEIDLLPAGWSEANASAAGPIASFSGVATPPVSGGVPIPFSGSITIDPSLASASTPLPWLQRVNGAVCNLDFSGNTQKLTLSVDPRTWFDSADFTSLVTSGPDAGLYGWTPTSAFNAAVLGQIQATTGVYNFHVSGGVSPAPDAGSTCPAFAATDDGGICQSDGGLCVGNFNAGFTAQTSTANSIGVTFSGETLAINGLPFAPVSQGDPYFVDGWNLTFSEYLFVVANVRLNQTPTMDQTWPDMGCQVAIKPGPYALDAHQAAGFVGKDGVEPASGLFLWTHKDDGSAFDPSVRYGFSYDEVKAQYPAQNVNLTPQDLPDYDLMVKNGWSKFIRGTATYVGTGTYTNPKDPDAGAAQADFSQLPTTVNFAFGWNDSTQMLNCVNYDWTSCEECLADRGISTNPNGTYIAQLTLHTDHVFWDELRHEGANLRFDPIAAFAPLDGGTFFINDSPQKIQTTFQNGDRLPDRAPYQPNASPNATPVNQYTSDGTGDGTQVILNVNATTGVPDQMTDFMIFSAQSQSHLNAQGLCYVVGQHANDPYFLPANTQVSP